MVIPISFTMTYTSGVTIDSIVYTGTDGEDVSVSEPPSGFTLDLEFVSPADFCYTVTGSTDSSGGELVIEVVTQRDGEQPALHRSVAGNSGAAPIDQSGCEHLY